MTSVAIGIPHYGPQPAEWWGNLTLTAVAMHDQGIEFGGLIPSGVSTTDINRNTIVDLFLSGKAEWLFWMDADNTPPIGTIPRLLGTGYKIVSGVYFGGDMLNKIVSVAYLRTAAGAYRTLDEVYHWERGEIVPVDAVGFGSVLVHRSVFETIQEKYAMLQRLSGGITCVRKDRIRGKLDPDARNSNDGQVHNGVLYERLIPLTVENPKFPFFGCEYGRTEDFWFCELAKSVGFEIYVDTSVEVGHVKTKTYTGKDFRKQNGLATNPEAQEVTYVWEAT